MLKHEKIKNCFCLCFFHNLCLIHKPIDVIQNENYQETPKSMRYMVWSNEDFIKDIAKYTLREVFLNSLIATFLTSA